jgi:hypothetical protein
MACGTLVAAAAWLIASVPGHLTVKALVHVSVPGGPELCRQRLPSRLLLYALLRRRRSPLPHLCRLGGIDRARQDDGRDLRAARRGRRYASPA